MPKEETAITEKGHKVWEEVVIERYGNKIVASKLNSVSQEDYDIAKKILQSSYRE